METSFPVYTNKSGNFCSYHLIPVKDIDGEVVGNDAFLLYQLDLVDGLALQLCVDGQDSAGASAHEMRIVSIFDGEVLACTELQFQLEKDQELFWGLGYPLHYENWGVVPAIWIQEYGAPFKTRLELFDIDDNAFRFQDSTEAVFLNKNDIDTVEFEVGIFMGRRIVLQDPKSMTYTNAKSFNANNCYILGESQGFNEGWRSNIAEV